MLKVTSIFLLTAAVMLAVFVFMLDTTLGMALLVGSGFLVVLNVASFAYINGAFEQRPAIVIRRYMASMTIKLLVSGGLMAWYMMSEHKDKPTAIFLVLLYFVLLMVNGYLSMRQVKRNWGNE